MSKLVARKKGVKRTVSIGKVAPETAEQVGGPGWPDRGDPMAVSLGAAGGRGGAAKSGR